MEALIAVGLAGNIVQFVDFASKIVSKSHQLQSSTSGALSENITTKQVTEDLKLLADKLCHLTSTDAALEELCLGCRSVAEELLAALAKLELKGNRSQFQSVRKALKSVWGKDMVNGIEKRLFTFRDQLNLHVTIELRSRIDALCIQESAAYQQLDDSAKVTAQVILDTLHNGQDLFTQDIQAQTDKIKSLHLETQRKVTEEVEGARVFVQMQHEQTKLEIVGAVDSAAVLHKDVVQLNALATASKIETQHELTRKNIVGTLERGHEIIKGDVAGLRRSLQQLQVEMDMRVKELKDIILQIDRTRRNEERQTLQKKGNSISVILMSLHVLYTELQTWLNTLLNRARKLFGPAKFEQYLEASISTSTPASVPLSPRQTSLASLLDAELSSSIQVLSTYYACYYYPPFSPPMSSSRPSLLKTTGCTWHRTLTLPEAIKTSISTISEHRAVLHLAKGALGQEVQNFVWLMAAIATALDALPQPRSADAAFILSGVFGLAYSKLSPARESGGLTNVNYNETGQYQGRRDVALTRRGWWRPMDVTSHHFWEDFLADDSTWQNQCERGSVRGKRLREDVEIWKFLANISGLRDEIPDFPAIGSSWPLSANAEAALLVCLLFAFIRFGAPCQVEANDGLGKPIVLREEPGIIIINPKKAPHLWTLVLTLHHIGLPFVFSGCAAIEDMKGRDLLQLDASDGESGGANGLVPLADRFYVSSSDAVEVRVRGSRGLEATSSQPST